MNKAFETAIELDKEYGNKALTAANTMLEEARRCQASETKIGMWEDVCTILKVGA
jgi:hypothetical protein